MIILFIRTIILYITIVFAMRLMGKRQIGQLEPSELVVAIIISDLASIPIENTDVPLFNGLIPIFTLVTCEILFSSATLKSKRFRTCITGTPGLLITKGKLNEKEMRRLRINIDDLLEELRKAGYPKIDSVYTAVLENNGVLNVIPKSQERPLTPKDIGLNPTQEILPYVFVTDGEILYSQLKESGKDEAWLLKELERQGIMHTKECLIAQYDGDRLYTQRRKQK